MSKKKNLIKTLLEFDILILDNASFHKNGTISRLLKKVSCGLWYLPPYSPDLDQSNIICEHYWANLRKFYNRKKEGWRNRQSVIESLQLCPNLTE